MKKLLVSAAAATMLMTAVPDAPVSAKGCYTPFSGGRHFTSRCRRRPAPMRAWPSGEAKTTSSARLTMMPASSSTAGAALKRSTNSWS